MQQETLASDYNRNALPRRRRRRRELPPDLEATAFRPVMPILSRRDPGVLKGAEVHPRGPSQGEGLGGAGNNC